MTAKQLSYNAYIEIKPSQSAACGLKRFFAWYAGQSRQNNDPDELSREILTHTEEEIKDIILEYFENEKKYTKLLPATQHSYMTAIIKFFERNKVRFDRMELSDIRTMLPRNVTVTDDDYLNVDKIRSILAHADTITRAFILLSASSGARISEILSLTESDLKYDSETDTFYFKKSYKEMKAGKAHKYFYSHEADKALREYLKVRPQYLSRAKTNFRRVHSEKEIDHLLFPVTDDNISYKLSLAVEKAGLLVIDKNSRHKTIHPHSFRKFADTVLKERLGINMGNEIIGHDEGLSSAYRRYDPVKVAEAYRKAEPYLTIEVPDDYVELKDHTGAELEKVRGMVAAQAMQINDMKERQQKNEEMILIMERLISQKVKK